MNDRLSTLLVVGSFVIDKLIVVGVFCLGVWLATRPSPPTVDGPTCTVKVVKQ